MIYYGRFVNLCKEDVINELITLCSNVITFETNFVGFSCQTDRYFSGIVDQFRIIPFFNLLLRFIHKMVNVIVQ